MLTNKVWNRRYERVKKWIIVWLAAKSNFQLMENEELGVDILSFSSSFQWYNDYNDIMLPTV